MFDRVALMHKSENGCGSIGDHVHFTCEAVPEYYFPHTRSSELIVIIRIAAQIQRLACACLCAMQQKFCIAVQSHLTASLPSPGQVKDFATAPSWIEEYRVYWALWHLRLYSDLRNLTRKNAHSMNGQDNPGSSCCSVERLDTYADSNGLVTPHGLLDHRIEEVWSVAAVLADLGLQVFYETPEQKQQEPPKARWLLPPQKSMPICISFELPRKGMQYPVWCPPPMPEGTDTEIAWNRSLRSVYSSTEQSRYFTMLSRQLERVKPSESGMRDLRPYRRLGAFIWDKWRIYSAGLMQANSRKRTPTPCGGFIDPNDVTLQTSQEMQVRWMALIGKV